MDSKLHSYKMERLESAGLGKVVRELSDGLVDENGEPKKDSDTADLLELGAALSENGQFERSNAVLEAVYRRFVESEEGPVISLRKTGSSFAEATISSGLSEYEPAEFEKIFLLAIKEKNYLLMGDLEGAAVEARRARLIERVLREKVDSEKASVTGDLSDGRAERKLRVPEEARLRMARISSSTENPFAMLLTAFTHIARGEIDDATIEARRAALASESGQAQNLLSALEGAGPLPNVYIFALCGRAPVKRQVDVRLINFSTGAMQKLSFPTYNPRGRESCAVRAEDVALEPAAFTDLLAYKEFEEKLPYEIFKTFTRAIARTAKDAALQREMKGLGGLIGTISNELMEGADTRSWTMLPKMVYFGAVNSSAEELRVEVEAAGDDRRFDLKINPGGINLIVVTANAQGIAANTASFGP